MNTGRPPYKQRALRKKHQYVHGWSMLALVVAYAAWIMLRPRHVVYEPPELFGFFGDVEGL